MDDKPKANTPPPGDLSDPLRQAVDHIRSSPVPADALARALDRAERIQAMTPRFNRTLFFGGLAGLAAAAAVVFVAVGGLSSESVKTDTKVATQVPGGAFAKKEARTGIAETRTHLGRPASDQLEARTETKTEDNIRLGGQRRAEERARPSLRDPEDGSGDLSTSRLQSAGESVPAAAAPAAPPVRMATPGPAARAAGRDAAKAVPEVSRDASAPTQRTSGPTDPDGFINSFTPQVRQQSKQALVSGAVGGGGGFAGALQNRARNSANSPAPASQEIGLDPPGSDRLFRKESEDALKERSKGEQQSANNSKDQPAEKVGKDQLDKKTEKGAALAAKPAAKAAPKARVWRQRSGPPTFARVYVGDGNALELVSLDVSVTVEGPRARTVVDHVFRNPNDRQLEGTFEYPLPSGASPSYFAMFLGQTRETVPPRFGRRDDKQANLPEAALAALTPEQLVRNVDPTTWGRLQEARVVNKEKALETYEEVVRGRIDPALLEYASGNTFRGRVFPIPARGFNRVVIAYEELLPVSGDKMLYRFPLPDRPLSGLHFTLQASASECDNREFTPAGGTMQEAAGRVYYSRNWADEAPEPGEVLFACTPKRADAQVVSGRQGENGPTYVYARVRPDLKKVAADKGAAEHAVFLLDTSLSEHADRFGVSVKLLRSILERDPAIKQFNVVTFNAAAAWLEPKGWLPNTKAGRDFLFRQLDGIVLEGATDVGAALDCLAEPPAGLPAKAPVDCFLLSDGHVTWGETDVGTLAARVETRCPFAPRFHCYLTGMGAENAELFGALTRRGGGIFSCRNEADLARAAVAHRSQCLQVKDVRFVGGPAVSDVLVAGRRAAVYPGGELVVAGRFRGTGATTLVVEGTFAGEPFAQEYPVEVKDGGELAPRGWAEIAVAALLGLNDPKLDSLVTAYCQQFNIGSRVASFLVLENEADYKRFNLEAERGKAVAGDLGTFLTKMWESMARTLTPREVFLRGLEPIENRVNLLVPASRQQVDKLIGLMSDKEFEVPAGKLAGAILHRADVPPEYLSGRDVDRRDPAPYLAEARRRANAGDPDGAVRALSSIIEENPARGDALRLVGYRLLDLKQPGQAVQLFERVQQQRPFEPHSYRDLGRALEETGNVALAAVQYEIVLGSLWHNRFGQSLKMVVQEEYARLMQDAIRRKAIGRALANYFGERLEQMSQPQPKADLRVTISWNTDATDVDLWVIEPDGTKCFYQHNRTKNGGELSQDQTQGYGPERYQVVKALKGKYRILVHYYANNANLLAGETHVNVVVTRAGGPDGEVTERHTVILRKRGEAVEVCDVDF